ncbi:hypothetical protein BS329_40195 [Amycolatopsis coloradensis]|uniref:Uncharacterized protein n=1 Tax=Amycolatopsis coloradensis TaxID=76021 RepID=A0A1R0KDW0_9PSEU|nr:hypothetical protein BS329_40195 [Amycolatopsis coloradensis]
MITTAVVHIAAGVSSRSRFLVVVTRVLLGAGRVSSVMTWIVAETCLDVAEPGAPGRSPARE